MKFEKQYAASIKMLETEEQRKNFLALCEDEDLEFQDVAKKIVARSRRHSGRPAPKKAAGHSPRKKKAVGA